VDDVNDKNPKFDKNSYIVYALESTPIGATVLTVSAFDADRNADLEYSIVEPITARDKTGNSLSNRVSKGLFWAIFQRCQMPVTGKRQIHPGKTPNNAKGRFKKRQIIFTPVGSRF
jgi:hypothetical protein